MRLKVTIESYHHAITSRRWFSMLIYILLSQTHELWWKCHTPILSFCKLTILLTKMYSFASHHYRWSQHLLACSTSTTIIPSSWLSNISSSIWLVIHLIHLYSFFLKNNVRDRILTSPLFHFFCFLPSPPSKLSFVVHWSNKLFGFKRDNWNGRIHNNTLPTFVTCSLVGGNKKCVQNFWGKTSWMVTAWKVKTETGRF
jgi:hypothetical protein